MKQPNNKTDKGAVIFFIIGAALLLTVFAVFIYHAATTGITDVTIK